MSHLQRHRKTPSAPKSYSDLLEIRGSGYTPVKGESVHKPPSSLAPRKLPPHTFGSGQRLQGFVQSNVPPPKSAMKRSGSVGSGLEGGRRTVMAPTTSYARPVGGGAGGVGSCHKHYAGGNNNNNGSYSSPSSSGSNNDRQVICNCQHPVTMAFMEDAYVKNLLNQLEILNVENEVLRKQSNRQTMSASYNRENTITLPSTSQGIYGTGPSGETITSSSDMQTWQKSVLGYSSGFSGNLSSSKRVDFTRPLISNSPGRGSGGAGGGGSDREGHNNANTEVLLDRLEEAAAKEARLESRIKTLTSENQRLSRVSEETRSKLDEMTGEILKLESSMTQEKRHFLEENIELQRRLDELTPLLADKEAQIARLMGEKDSMSARLRVTGSQIDELQSKLSTDLSMTYQSTEARQQVERLQSRLENMEREIDNFRQRELSSIDERNNLERKLKDEEAYAQRQSNLYQKALEDKESANREVSNLRSEIIRLESTITNQRAELESQRRVMPNELETAKLTEQRLKAEITRLEDRLHSEQHRFRQIENQLRDREFIDAEELVKTQRELEGLKALSESLTRENSSLRKQRIDLDEKLELLQKKNQQFSTKDLEIRELKRQIDDFDRKYAETTVQLQRDVEFQANRARELEEIVRKVHELSDSSSYQSQHQSTTSSFTQRKRLSEMSSSVVSVDNVHSDRSKRSSSIIERSYPKQSSDSTSQNF